MGLLAKANDDVLLSVVDARRALRGEPRIPTEVFAGGKPGGGEQGAMGKAGRRSARARRQATSTGGGFSGIVDGRSVRLGGVSRLASWRVLRHVRTWGPLCSRWSHLSSARTCRAATPRTSASPRRIPGGAGRRTRREFHGRGEAGSVCLAEC